MKTYFKKISLSAFIFALAFSFNAAGVKASTDYSPSISIKKSNDTSVTLRISSSQLESKKVKIKIRVENKDTDTVATNLFERRMNKKGNTDIKIGSLTEETEYGFKVLIKKTSDQDYSDYSNEVTINTAGIKDYQPTVNVTDVSDKDVTLKVSAAAKLAKKRVTIKVWIENNDNDAVETRVFTKTLNKSASVHFKVGSLSSDTEYNFKAMIKKTSDSSYSEYSKKVTQKTDE